ncbi:MAG: spore germination protein [Candidatus Merdivicinus sp.]|jgi:spore germination protein KA
MRTSKPRPSQSPSPSPQTEGKRLTGHLSEDLISIRTLAHNTADLITRPLTICGISINLIMMEGMVDLNKLDQAVIRPLLSRSFSSAEAVFDWVEQTAVVGDVKDVYEYEQILSLVMTGFLAFLVDGVPRAIIMGIQGYPYRSISEPGSEVNEKGSRESFTEPLKINLTMIRRRMRSGSICFENIEIGSDSHTLAAMVYNPAQVSPELLQEVRNRLRRIPMKMVLDSGYLQPFLEGQTTSLFSEVGMSERPDTVCAKVLEGRIAILVDGSPYALIVPYLFIENFQSFDDYSRRPYFAGFIRLLKYIAFFISIFLPGIYVAVATFHPAVLPHALLFNIASAEETTPFPLVFEALIIHFLYEIMREAGLRLPRPVGHAVSIVGALVIGDAAVTAGIIGAPMVMVVALTAISSFVVPSLYEPTAVLRFIFIILAGLTGLYGMAIAGGALLINICRINSLGIPYTAPLSPFTPKAMRDVLIRFGWKKMAGKSAKIQDLNGSDL